jgi:hypothetical protein
MDPAAQLQMILSYMRAWVLMHAKCREGWTDAEIQDAFFLLPPPSISINEWLMNKEAPPLDQEQPQPSVEHKPGMIIANDESGRAVIEAKIKEMQETASKLK